MDGLEKYEALIFGPDWANTRALEREILAHVRKRSWKERFLSWPWRPWRKWETIAQWTPEEIERLKSRVSQFTANKLPPMVKP